MEEAELQLLAETWNLSGELTSSALGGLLSSFARGGYLDILKNARIQSVLASLSSQTDTVAVEVSARCLVVYTWLRR